MVLLPAVHSNPQPQAASSNRGGLSQLRQPARIESAAYADQGLSFNLSVKIRETSDIFALFHVRDAWPIVSSER